MIRNIVHSVLAGSARMATQRAFTPVGLSHCYGGRVGYMKSNRVSFGFCSGKDGKDGKEKKD